MRALPFSGCSVDGLTAAETVTLVNELTGGQSGLFVLLNRARHEGQDRSWLRCYRAGCIPLSFGFSRRAGRIRVTIEGLEALGFVALREPEFNTISAALEAVRAVIEAMPGF